MAIQVGKHAKPWLFGHLFFGADPCLKTWFRGKPSTGFSAIFVCKTTWFPVDAPSNQLMLKNKRNTIY